MTDINKIIGKNLLTLRKNSKLTQLELAEKFNYSDKSISKWENGESLPSVEILYELANFYNVTLDSLAKEDFKIPSNEDKNITKDRMFPTKLIITLLAVSAVWFCATVFFVCIKIVFNINYGLLFVWALPASCIVLLVFNSLWGRSLFLFPILSILIWTTLLSIHLPLAQYNVWIIYILGIPLQVAVILWSTLNNNRKQKKQKQPKEKKVKEKKVKEQKSNKKASTENNYNIINNNDNDNNNNTSTDTTI